MANIGVIGLGYWGPNLVRNFYKLGSCEKVAVADLDSRRTSEVKGRFPNVICFDSCQELLTSDNIDAVVIATPVANHHELAMQALSRGKHVLVEKPLAGSARQAQEMMREAERSNRKLMVGHTFVYSGAVRAIREIVRRGDLGAIYHFDSVRANLGLIRLDVNVIWDLAPHDFSILHYVLGWQAVSITVAGVSPFSFLPKNHVCLANAAVRLPGGALASIQASWLSPVKTRRIVISGDKRMLVYDDTNAETPVLLFDKGVDCQGGREGISYRQGQGIPVAVDRTEPLETECRHFLECVETGCRPLTDGLAGLEVIRALEAAQRSVEGGGRTVLIDE